MKNILKFLLAILLVLIIIILVLIGIVNFFPNLYPTLRASQGFSPTQEISTLLPTFSSPTHTPTNVESIATPDPTIESPVPEPVPTRIKTEDNFSSLPKTSNYHWSLYTTGFNTPIYLTHANDNSHRNFIAEKSGVIWIIEDDYKFPTPFLDIHERIGSEQFEQGLLGLAFHPDYLENGLFFVNYTDLKGNTIIARYQVSADPDIADPGTEHRILEVIQPYPNHNGGHVLFGPDDYLYIGLGDGGLYADPAENGQNPSSLLGKMLRLDIDSVSPYAIPDGNYSDHEYTALPEVWAVGLRNPWRYTFDSLTGDFYIADVGQDKWEEINYVSATNKTPLNFGWDYYEGTHEFENTPPDNFGAIFPVAEYQHENGNCSVAGGFVYRGESMPEWHGIYLYSDFCSGTIWGLWQSSEGMWENEIIYQLNTYMTSFGEDENGEIYFLTLDGVIFRLERK